MKLLLDTHILLWWLNDDNHLTKKVKNLISDTENVIYISAASIWEMSIKQQLGKLTLPGDIQTEILQNGFKPLVIDFPHAQLAGTLDPHHKDPFDRMLIAQAKIEEMTLITADPCFSEYDISCLLV